MAEDTSKKKQFEETLQNKINSILRKNFSDSRLQFVSITKVELSTDFANAIISWDTFDPSKRGDAKKAIQGISGRLRSLLAKTLKVRHTPSLTFVYDAEFEASSNIEAILAEEAKKGKGFS